MAYLAIAYPGISGADYKKIQDYRRVNDEWLFTVVDPHVTFVFPVFDMPEKDFVAEVEELCNDARKIDFVFRCAIINKDSFSDYYHALLAPDEGFSQIVKLHDKLYSRNLKPHHRMDIDFIPHIGIGNSKDVDTCKKMVDEWNENDFSIAGTISHLTIVRYENDIVEDIKKIRLK